MKTIPSFFIILYSFNLVAQIPPLGWNGQPIIPNSSFTNPSYWHLNSTNGDTCFVTSSPDSCYLFLNWKFALGKRNKFVQCYMILDPLIDLSTMTIFGIDIRGSLCKNNRNVELKFEDGSVQASIHWESLGRITRFCNRLAILKKQFSNSSSLKWDSVKVISLGVFSSESDNDIEADSGVITFTNFVTAPIDSINRIDTLEHITPSAELNLIKNNAATAILNRQSDSLLYTWTEDSTSWLYGQGMALIILTREGTWAYDIAQDSFAKGAEKLARFFVNHQETLGHWPRAWRTTTNEIIVPYESDSTVWMGDFPWIIIGLQEYLKKSGDLLVDAAIQKAKKFLLPLIKDNGTLYTKNVVSNIEKEVFSFEAYASTLWGLYALGEFSTADLMLNKVIQNSWEDSAKYLKETSMHYRPVLLTNTWLSPLLYRKKNKDKATEALSFVGNVLYTNSLGFPVGLDGVGPIATWYEGTYSYISTGGPGSQFLFDNLKNYIIDGTVPAYNDSLGSIAGIWAVEWLSLDATSWLYFAASRYSPFDSIEVDTLVSIDKNNFGSNITENLQFSIRNRVNGSILIQWESYEKPIVSLKIYTVSGVLLYSKKFYGKSGLINLNNKKCTFSPGVYCIRINNGSKFINRKFVIINL